MLTRSLCTGLCLIALGCSSQRILSVDSKQKEVNVFVLDKKTSNYVSLGVTPLQKNTEEIQEYGQGDYVSLRLVKEGHVSENYVINIDSSDRISVFGNLEEIADWTSPASEGSSTVANKLVSSVQLVNSAIKKGEFEKALADVNRLITQFPKASILHDLKGTIHYLNGRLDRSIASYQESLKINPSNIQTKQMLEKIQENKR